MIQTVMVQIKKTPLFLLALLISSSFGYAQFEPEFDAPLELESPLSKVPSKNVMIQQLGLVENAIVADRYEGAIKALDALMALLKSSRQAQLITLFPGSFDQFKVGQDEVSDDLLFSGGSDFGVVFTQTYRHEERESAQVDVHLVYGEAQTQEYVRVLSNKKLASTLPNAQLTLSEGGYKTLLKFAEEDRVCEITVLLRNNLILNVVGIGIESPDEIRPLINAIQKEALLDYFD